jgi:c-di-AMP phosphodiesterase-like protein
MGGKTPANAIESAQAALDLAHGRGGDQAVIKRGSKIEYYGGKTRAVEKSNKGKSRIMAHAIRQLMEQSSKIIIMGHRNPDIDSFGSAMGVFRMAANINKETYIVINKVGENLSEIYKQARETDIYNFISNEKALAIANMDTLLIVVDTHRPSVTECPGLLEATDKIVVLDHHRRAEEVIENPVLAYMEPSASSTSELVTEMLQYSKDRKNFSKLKAEARLAGITVDTNRFAGATGVRTFEAASWLRKAGADTSAVRRFFQTDTQAFKIKANCVAKAEFLEGGIVISICEGTHPEMNILNSQAADTLLEIKGMRASFVAGSDSEGMTLISARSLGEINVQVIMEGFGGGGHMMVAGAQTDLTPEETIKKIKRIFEDKS